MDTLSQLDIQSPDHVSIITRDGRVTVSVTKDGTSVTVGFPTFQTKGLPALQQQVPLIKTKPNDQVSRLKPLGGLGTKHFRYGGTTPKLNESQVKEIKMMLSDPDIMKKFRSITEAYQEIGKAYDVTGCAISNIARGIAWKHVKI
jgi:hypothetical protein